MDRLIGIFLIVAAAVSFATSPVFARIAYDAGTTPNTFLFIRFAIAASVIILIMIFKGLTWPRGRLLVTLILIGGVCFAGVNFFLHRPDFGPRQPRNRLYERVLKGIYFKTL